MHPQAYQFVREHAPRKGLGELRVLELGSYNVNGTARDHFPGAIYVGIDRTHGPGVDVVCEAADYKPDRLFDVVISTEAAEHTEHPADIIHTAHRLLVRGGRLIFTCAADPRRPHGCMGTSFVPPDEYYKNVDPGVILQVMANSTDWAHVHIEHDREHGDLRVFAIKA
jgi:SAM-dependent methyltransferase